jgi:hypothetical protein
MNFLHISNRGHIIGSDSTETVYLSLCGDNEHIVLWMGTWQSDKGVVGGVVSDRHRAYTF